MARRKKASILRGTLRITEFFGERLMERTKFAHVLATPRRLYPAEL
jgi:hypothetical protein